MKVPVSQVAKFKKPPKEVLSKKQVKAFEEYVKDRIDRQKNPGKYADEKVETEEGASEEPKIEIPEVEAPSV